VPNSVFTNPVGGFWPLGRVNVPTPGVPVPITDNIGSQQQGSQKFSRPVKQVIIRADPNNVGNVAVIWNGLSATYLLPAGLPYTIDILVPTGVCSLPNGGPLESNKINLDAIAIDVQAGNGGDGAFVTAIY
jgi:hypothetical protein